MTDLKFYIVVVGIFAIFMVARRRPIVALLAFLALVFLRPQDDRPNLADLRLPLMFLIMVVVMYVVRARAVHEWIPKSLLIKPLIGLWVCVAISAAVGVNSERSFSDLTEFSIAIATLVIMLRLIRNEEELKMVLQFMVVIGLAYVYYALFNGSDCLETQDGTGCGRRNFVKLNRNFGQPNYLGLSLVIFFNIAYGLYLGSARRLHQAMLLAAMAALVSVLFLTNSRGAFLAFAVTILIHWAFSKHKLSSLLLLIGLATLTWFLLPDSVVERIETLTEIKEDTSAMHRLELWEIAFGLIAHNPLFGVGIGNFEEFAPNTPHNAYIQIASEYGIPALLFWLWLMFSALRGLFRVRRAAIEEGNQFFASIASGQIGAVFAILVQSWSTGLAHREFVYIILALSGVTILLFKPKEPVGVKMKVPQELSVEQLQAGSQIASKRG
jgi:putative inorganic carbon (hco3(-)) transporter